MAQVKIAKVGTRKIVVGGRREKNGISAGVQEMMGSQVEWVGGGQDCQWRQGTGEEVGGAKMWSQEKFLPHFRCMGTAPRQTSPLAH